MLAFINIFYFGLGYRMYELIQNDALFYTIQVVILLLLNLLNIKFKKPKIIFNLIVILGLIILFIFPYMRGEKIYNKINCTYELVNEVKKYREKNGDLPSHLNLVEAPKCASELNIHYEILRKDEYNKNNRAFITEERLLKEDSFLITLRIPELLPMSLKFAGHLKEYSND